MKKEEWRFVVGYEGYMVSNFGNVKTLNWNRSGKERLLKQHRVKKYLRVCLYKDGAWKLRFVHDLVAFAFPEICGEWHPGSQVNHKDCNPQNNEAWNLEWCTAYYNCNYGDRNEKISIGNRRYPKPVIQYDLAWNFVKEWKSPEEVEKELVGFSANSIKCCCIGRQKKHNGFYWKYVKYDTKTQ